jgi:hypothetical protein
MAFFTHALSGTMLVEEKLRVGLGKVDLAYLS